MQKRLHVVFHGSVQGVGFRFTAESVAQSLGVTGWVKNLRNGDVEVVAEGGEVALENLVSRLKDRFRGYIKDQDVTWAEATGEFKDFGISF